MIIAKTLEEIQREFSASFVCALLKEAAVRAAESALIESAMNSTIEGTSSPEAVAVRLLASKRTGAHFDSMASEAIVIDSCEYIGAVENEIEYIIERHIEPLSNAAISMSIDAFFSGESFLSRAAVRNIGKAIELIEMGCPVQAVEHLKDAMSNARTSERAWLDSRTQRDGGAA